VPIEVLAIFAFTILTHLCEEAIDVLWETLMMMPKSCTSRPEQRRQIKANAIPRPARKGLAEIIGTCITYAFYLDKRADYSKMAVFTAAKQRPWLATSSLLNQQSEIFEEINAEFLVRNWPPAFTEWSTKTYATLSMLRRSFRVCLKRMHSLQPSLSGVTGGQLAYVGPKNY
jgi:hypothetical protein